MKIGIISDTHGDLRSWEKALAEIFSDADLVLHAGDVLYHGPRNPLPEGYNPQELAKAINSCPLPVLLAKGNCDAEVDQMVLNMPYSQPYLFTQLENKRILVHHGHLFPVEELERLVEQWKIDLCITGHTHLAKFERKNGCCFFNPGSCSLPKETHQPTVGLWEKNTLSLIDLSSLLVLNMFQL